MKTKDILIGLVLGMMIAGATAEIVEYTKQIYSIEISKEKVDYLSKGTSPNTFLTNEVQEIVDLKYKREKREEALNKIDWIIDNNQSINKAIECLNQQIPTTTTTLETTTTTTLKEIEPKT